MAKRKYREIAFVRKTVRLIEEINEIVDEYQGQGYTLTLRQLFYQMVSRGKLANDKKNYSRLSRTVTNGRDAGLIDWEAIEDRTRKLRTAPSWDSPAEIVESAAEAFGLDRWEGQEYRPEVWIEKDALTGVFGRICEEENVPFFSCRGYSSTSGMETTGRRLAGILDSGQIPVILHFGDHDPSGVHMSADIESRLTFYAQREIPVKRVALSWEQIKEHDLLPNPTKPDDPRWEEYRQSYGEECWELDALKPEFLVDLVKNNIAQYRDQALWDEIVEREESHRSSLKLVSENWPAIVEFLSGQEGPL